MIAWATPPVSLDSNFAAVPVYSYLDRVRADGIATTTRKAAIDRALSAGVGCFLF